MADTTEIRKSVVFVGFEKHDGTRLFAGSAFLIRYEGAHPRVAPVFLVTARHVIDKIRGLGLEEVLVRYNSKGGQAVWEAYRINQWQVHPSARDLDVAFLHLGDAPPDVDHLTVPTGMFAHGAVLAQHGVIAGDEVFMVGLFYRHVGRDRNIPIVRVGNIACLDEEKVATKELGLIDAYLVEARSTGGLSGSPVFMDLHRPRMDGRRNGQSDRGIVVLGLVHGHYDVEDDVTRAEPVNAGIALIVPAKSIEVAMEPYLQQQATLADVVKLPGPYFAPVLSRRRLDER